MVLPVQCGLGLWHSDNGDKSDKSDKGDVDRKTDLQNKLAASLDAKLVRSLTNSATSVAKNSKQLKGDKNCDAYKQTHSVPESKVVDKQTMLTMCLPTWSLPYLLNAKSN